MTRALVIGAGSIGTRHAEVLSASGHEVAVVSSRKLDRPATYADTAEAVAGFAPEYVVVATETARHASSVDELRAAGYTGRVLVEKPLAVDSAQLAGFDRVGVGFNLRFHPVIRRFAELIKGARVHTVEAYAGQALEQWRPGRALAEQYSSSRAQGGGVLRDLSHELDYLGWMLGPCRGVFARGGRLAELTVDSDDAWGIVSEYRDAPVVTLQLNYLDTRGRRRIVANTSVGTIEADVIAGVIQSSEGVEQLTVARDDSYRAMHAAMLDGGSGDGMADVATPEQAAETDALIGMIELSSTEQRWVAA